MAGVEVARGDALKLHVARLKGGRIAASRAKMLEVLLCPVDLTEAAGSGTRSPSSGKARRPSPFLNQLMV